MVTLFPKDEIFYGLFEAQAKKLSEASVLLEELMGNPQYLEELAAKIKKIEVEADSLGHSVVERLRKSFLTPIDGEDIDLLRQKLDDIMDCIEKAVNRMVIYKIQIPFPGEIKEYILILKRAIEKINIGVKEIRNVRKHHENLHSLCEELNRLEDEGDVINRTALRNLMNVTQITPERALEIIKLKEIFETLENAIDACEDVGNIFESILIKNQ